jgi:RimJ/RimL family protein N-acetyltransferase
MSDVTSRTIALEPVAPRHAEAVQALASHPDVVATTNLPEPYPEDGAEQWIDYVQPRHEAGEEYAFAIKNADDTLVGVTGLRSVTDTKAELGFWIGKPYWGQGYATAAARQTLVFAFEDVGLEVVFARPLRRNAPSRRVLEKLGFEEGPVETHEHPKWDEDDKVVRCTVARAEWKQA